VLGNGELLEYDTPDVLISDRNSHFASLVEQTGTAEAEHLRILTNSTGSYAKRNRAITVLDEERLSEEDETDPLVPSMKSL
jgi:hypothetical protein